MRKLVLRANSQSMVILHGINFREATFHGRHHLAVIRSCLHQRAQTKALGILAHGALLQQMRRSHWLSAQLPVPVIWIVPCGLVEAVERRTTKEISKRFHRLERDNELAKIARICACGTVRSSSVVFGSVHDISAA